jgi:hypothetical protein
MFSCFSFFRHSLILVGPRSPLFARLSQSGWAGEALLGDDSTMSPFWSSGRRHDPADNLGRRYLLPMAEWML